MSIATEIQRLQTAKADIKTAIENKGVTVGDGTIDTYAEKIDEIEVGGDYDQGYEDGKNSAPQLERYATSLKLPSLNVLGAAEATLNLDNSTSLNSFCYVGGQDNPNRNTTVEHITVNCTKELDGIEYFIAADNYNYDTTLKRITLNADTSKATYCYGAFYNLRALEIIDGAPINLSSATNMGGFFHVAQSLIEVRFVEKSIPLSLNTSRSPCLSADTIQSIIDGLADLTDSTTQTLTFHADVGANLTDEQKATITAKNWTLAY